MVVDRREQPALSYKVPEHRTFILGTHGWNVFRFLVFPLWKCFSEVSKWCVLYQALRWSPGRCREPRDIPNKAVASYCLLQAWPFHESSACLPLWSQPGVAAAAPKAFGVAPMQALCWDFGNHDFNYDSAFGVALTQALCWDFRNHDFNYDF